MGFKEVIFNSPQNSKRVNEAFRQARGYLQGIAFLQGFNFFIKAKRKSSFFKRKLKVKALA